MGSKNKIIIGSKQYIETRMSKNSGANASADYSITTR